MSRHRSVFLIIAVASAAYAQQADEAIIVGSVQDATGAAVTAGEEFPKNWSTNAMGSIGKSIIRNWQAKAPAPLTAAALMMASVAAYAADTPPHIEGFWQAVVEGTYSLTEPSRGGIGLQDALGIPGKHNSSRIVVTATNQDSSEK